MSSTEAPVISVCIANYNGMAIIDNCLRSVMEQDYDVSIEIIVHDDASPDGSAAHIRSKYPGVRLIESADNVGFCVANNRMAQKAQGDYLLLLNNDAELFPDALRTLHDLAMRAEQPIVLGLPQYDAANGELIDRGSLFDPFLNPIPNLDAQRTDVGMIIGACLWVPKTLWDEIGGFPEWFHTLAEDMYVCCVARLWGYPIQVSPTSGFRHWVGKSLGGGKITTDKMLNTSRRRRALSERNKTFAMLICFPLIWLLLILPLHLLLLYMEGLLLTLIKKDTGIWKKIYAPLMPAIWHARANIFSQRSKTQRHRRIRMNQFASVFQSFPYKLKMLCKYGLPHIQ